MKKLVSLILIGTMALSLAACGNTNPNKNTTEESQVETKPTEQSQPEYFKKFEATGEIVKSDNKIRELMPIREYEDMWKKLTYTVFTFSQEGINGKVPSEENNYVLSLKYEELLGVPMKDIYVIMPESCEGVKDFSMLAFISGSEDSTQLFDDFVKEPRDMTMDIGSREAIEFFLECETSEDFLLYDYVLNTYGQPSEISVQYDGEENGYVMFASYKMEEWVVTFAFGEYNQKFRHLLIIEPVREEEETTESNTQQTEPTIPNNGVESPYKDKT